MYNILNFTIMFFQTINQMITAGTDLSINIRRVNNNLTVAVVPRRSGVKDGERIVPLILNGTPEELDAGFLQAVGTPVQKAQGILTNLETFEKQAEQAVSQSKAARSAAEKESKEVREKREKMEKLLKKAEDAMTGKRYSEALTWLKQAKVLALPDKQKEIDEKMVEVQKKASEGSLFGMEQPSVSKPQPAPQQTASQPAAAPASQYRSGEQIPMFLPEQPAPVSQPVSQPQPPRTANAIYRTAANTIRTIYYFRTTSATGSATGSSTTARNPVSSTSTDATGTDRRKAMDATGSATATVCTGTGGRKNL